MAQTTAQDPFDHLVDSIMDTLKREAGPELDFIDVLDALIRVIAVIAITPENNSKAKLAQLEKGLCNHVRRVVRTYAEDKKKMQSSGMH